MSLTVTRPCFLPPYSGSDCVSDTLAFPSDTPRGVRGVVPPGDDGLVDGMTADDIVGTSRRLEAPLIGVPGHSIIVRQGRGRMIACQVTSALTLTRPMRSSAGSTNAAASPRSATGSCATAPSCTRPDS